MLGVLQKPHYLQKGFVSGFCRIAQSIESLPKEFFEEAVHD